MNSYNGRNYDKDINPITMDIDKVLSKSSNVLRMIFSSNNRINGTDTAGGLTLNIGNPIFKVDTQMFLKFDPNRPIFFYVDNLLNTHNMSPSTTLYYLVWRNGPFSSNHCWSTSTNGYAPIIGCFANTANMIWTYREIPYKINSVNDLMSNGTWEFALVTTANDVITSSTLSNASNYLISLVFYQM